VFKKDIISLIADGFEVGVSSSVNTNAANYFYVAFKEAANVLKMGTYPGDGADNVNITGVGFQPDMVFIKNYDQYISSVVRPSDIVGDSSCYIHSTAAAANLIQSLDADGFQIGSNNAVNQNADDMI